MSDLTPEQRVQRNSLAVMTHPKYRPLGGIIMMGKTTVEEDAAQCPTAYTDGFNVVYGAAYIATLRDEEIRFLILHESMHKALRHLTTWLWMWKEHPELANRACDYVINLLLFLSDEGTRFILMPSQGCLDMRFKDMDAGEVYRMLKQEKESGKGGGSGEGFDSHKWEVAKDQTPAEAAAIGDEVKRALQQGALLVGKLGGDVARAVSDILKQDKDWREELWEYITHLCGGRDISTWRRPSRRSVDSGNYTPSYYSESVGRIVIAVDTSGSITGKVIAAFLGTVMNIAESVKPELIDLLYWDSQVAAHEKYGEGQYDTVLASTKPKGGGGTSPSCVSTYLSAKGIRPECIIILTDGAVGSDWGQGWTAPVLWCLVDNKRTTAANGRTIHLREG